MGKKNKKESKAKAPKVKAPKAPKGMPKELTSIFAWMEEKLGASNTEIKFEVAGFKIHAISTITTRTYKKYFVNEVKVSGPVVKYILDHEGRKKGETTPWKKIIFNKDAKAWATEYHQEYLPTTTAAGKKNAEKNKKEILKDKAKKGGKKSTPSIFSQEELKTVIKKKAAKKAVATFILDKPGVKDVIEFAFGDTKKATLTNILIAVGQVEDIPSETLKDAFVDLV